jgi:phenylpyruvate tautomerase PptA (4-oxalocrotonate tautomerase family)
MWGKLQCFKEKEKIIIIIKYVKNDNFGRKKKLQS